MKMETMLTTVVNKVFLVTVHKVVVMAMAMVAEMVDVEEVMEMVVTQMGSEKSSRMLWTWLH